MLCKQGKQPELRNSNIIKPRDLIHHVCHLDVYVYFLLTIIMSCILRLPIIKIITYANDVLNMYRVTEIVCVSNYHCCL